MTSFTKLWRAGILAATLLSLPVGSAPAAPISAPFRCQSSLLSTTSSETENHTIALLVLFAGAGEICDGNRYAEYPATMLPVGYDRVIDFRSEFVLTHELPILDDPRFVIGEVGEDLVSTFRVGEQGIGSELMQDKPIGCDFRHEGCHAESAATVIGAESATGVSKPTAILLLVIGFIGLMRARGKPIN